MLSLCLLPWVDALPPFFPAFGPSVGEWMDNGTNSKANSEHSRHWFFSGKMVIDGEEQEKTLFRLVKDTLPKVRGTVLCDAVPYGAVRCGAVRYGTVVAAFVHACRLACLFLACFAGDDVV